LSTYHYFRRLPGQTDADLIRAEVDQMVACEALGFDGVWLTEHHFAEAAISAAPSTLAAAVLARTTHLRVGLAVYVLPLHDPIRLAEEIATLDVLSGGRFTVGIGRGNRPAEFTGFGVPQEESRARFEEALQIMLAAWTQSHVEYQGRFARILATAVYPKPLTQPHPPLVVAAGTADTAAWAARHGYPMLNSGEALSLARCLALRASYQAALAAAGYDAATTARLLGQWAVNKCVYVAPTDEQARAEVRVAWGGLPGDGLLIGSPRTVLLGIQQLAAAGVGELLCWTSFGLPVDQVRRSMQLFASDVLPLCRAQRPSPASRGSPAQDSQVAPPSPA
jgi:alkanesulfonate monooxygenase SsuD/methylene tetrahydromethanopterin reductase-like flavin-dependent oxidoreductase (luciferase family)